MHPRLYRVDLNRMIVLLVSLGHIHVDVFAIDSAAPCSAILS